MWIFMLLAGAALGMSVDTTHDATHDAARTTLVRPIAAVASLAWLAGLIVVLPITLAEAAAHDADELLRAKRPAPAAQAYLDAARSLPFSNSDYLYRAARAQAFAGAPIDEIRQTIARAIAANPRSPGNYSFLARLEAQQPKPDMSRVSDAYEHFLALDPNDVQSRLQYAQSLDAASMKTEARVQYQAALDKDSQLEPKDPKRLSPEQVERIREKLIHE
jgi:predicted Zn-dependent protease